VEVKAPGSSQESFLLLELDTAYRPRIHARDTDVAVSAGAVAHAIDSSGQRHLLIPVDQTQSSLDDTSRRGVSVRTHSLIDKNAERRYIDVACLLPQLNDLFALLCDEIIARLRETPDNPSMVCRTVLDRWRELLAPADGVLLGQQALVGLIAELHLLEQLAVTGPSHAIALWTGPYRSRFDFTGRLAAAEVKATTMRERVEVEIHGLTQLDPPMGIELALYIERLEHVPEGGDSVPDVVGRLHRAGCDPVELSRRLHEYGYSTLDSDLYRNMRYRALESRWYLVDDPLPRIIASSFATPEFLNRIGKVRYSIDLTSSPPVPLGSYAVKKFIEKLTTEM
jgi:hypothetical protein